MIMVSAVLAESLSRTILNGVMAFLAILLCTFKKNF